MLALCVVPSMKFEASSLVHYFEADLRSGRGGVGGGCPGKREEEALS